MVDYFQIRISRLKLQRIRIQTAVNNYFDKYLLSTKWSSKTGRVRRHFERRSFDIELIVGRDQTV